MRKTMTFEEYIKEYKRLRGTKSRVSVRITVPVPTMDRIREIAKKVDININSLLSHMLTQLVIQYDYDHILLPELIVGVEDGEEDKLQSN